MTKVELSPMCLQCHGSPENSPENSGIPEEQWTNIDRFGFEMENWTLTDFGGAVSVTFTEKVDDN